MIFLFLGHSFSYLTTCQAVIHVEERSGNEVYTNEFASCLSLTTVTFSDSIEVIGNGAFSGSTKLNSVTFPPSLTTIRRSAFSGCSSIISLELPEGVETLDIYAFSNMINLESLMLPNTLKSVGSLILQKSLKVKLAQRSVTGGSPEYVVVADKFLITNTSLVVAIPSVTSDDASVLPDTVVELYLLSIWNEGWSNFYHS